MRRVKLAFIAFAIAMAIFPVHTWMLEAQSKASAGVATILSGTMLLLGAYGMMRISLVVFPVPGGPQRMSDIGASPSTSLRSGVPGPSRWRWPSTSSRVRGRIRTASGACSAARWLAESSKRVSATTLAPLPSRFAARRSTLPADVRARFPRRS